MTYTRTTDAPVPEEWGEQLTVEASDAVRRGYNLRPGYHSILIEPSAAMRMHFVPLIKEAWFYDVSQGLDSRWIDLRTHWDSDELGIALPKLTHGVRDTSAAHPVAGGTGSVLDSWATGDFLYLATDERTGGFYFDIGNNNLTASVLSAAYSGVAAFTAVTITDETDGGGNTLGEDGSVTFDTVPGHRVWVPKTLPELIDPSGMPDALQAKNHYWTRFSVGTGLDATVSLLQVASLHRVSVGGAASVSGGGLFKATEYTLPLHPDRAAIEVRSQAGVVSITLDITYLRQ